MHSSSLKTYLNDPKLWAQYNAGFVVGKPDECWIWIGYKQAGYGKVNFSTKSPVYKGTVQVVISATRISYYLVHQEIIDDWRIQMCHSCDNPSCVNPFHIFKGTHADNNADKMSKGRFVKVLGSSQSNSKLTDDQVREIRKSITGKFGEYKALAKKYGVSDGLIHHIVKGRAWRHVT